MKTIYQEVITDEKINRPERRNKYCQLTGSFPTGDEKAPGTVEQKKLCLPILWQTSPQTPRREMSLQPAPKQMSRIY